jgi:hypothetical protein
VLSARSWWRACAAALLLVQISADGAAALPHPGDLWIAPATLESHHGAQCVRMHDAAQCAQCQYHATRPLPAVQRRIQLATRIGVRIGTRERPRTIVARSRVSTAPPRAPPSSTLIQLS